MFPEWFRRCEYSRRAKDTSGTGFLCPVSKTTRHGIRIQITVNLSCRSKPETLGQISIIPTGALFYVSRLCPEMVWHELQRKFGAGNLKLYDVFLEIFSAKESAALRRGLWQLIRLLNSMSEIRTIIVWQQIMILFKKDKIIEKSKIIIHWCYRIYRHKILIAQKF